MCLTYRFWPFQQLNIEEIATRFSASTTPVREVLARLAGEGLIDNIPNRGYFARHVTVDEVRCRLDLLFLLLQHALQSSPRAPSWKEPGPAPQNDRACHPITIEANCLYLSIAAMSHNILLVPEITRHLDLTRCIRSIDLENAARRTEWTKSLADLRSCLQKGDRDEASLRLQQQHEALQARLPELIHQMQLKLVMAGANPSPFPHSAGLSTVAAHQKPAFP